jgi:hypothetical protein
LRYRHIAERVLHVIEKDETKTKLKKLGFAILIALAVSLSNKAPTDEMLGGMDRQEIATLANKIAYCSGLIETFSKRAPGGTEADSVQVMGHAHGFDMTSDFLFQLLGNSVEQSKRARHNRKQAAIEWAATLDFNADYDTSLFVPKFYACFDDYQPFVAVVVQTQLAHMYANPELFPIE